MSEWKVHLEFEEDNSSKFWRARVEGKTLFVNYGKIGSAGQTQMKELASPEAAQKELEKLEKEKRKKGYLDAGGGGDDAGDDEDEESDEADEDGDDDEEEAAKPRKTGKPAPAGVSARLTLASKGRAVETRLVLEGAKVRVESEETYDSVALAQKAFDRLKQALVDDGYKEK
jgi:predicted DNA-binding WGR domain protein